jgi:hypothetical protein
MNENFKKFTLNNEEKDEKYGSYKNNDFFDSISNSTVVKNRETREEKMHQK